MLQRVRQLVLLASLPLVAGCPTFIAAGDAHAPVEIMEPGDTASFPLQVGAYRRGKMYMFEPEMRNYSIAYDRYDVELQNAVTLFFKSLPRASADQCAQEKDEIFRAHSGCVLLRERTVSLPKNGSEYPACVATFRYDEVFARQQQRVFSQLLLVSLPDRLFKVRSTTPIGQADAATASMFDLLGRVNWTQ